MMSKQNPLGQKIKGMHQLQNNNNYNKCKNNTNNRSKINKNKRNKLTN